MYLVIVDNKTSQVNEFRKQHYVLHIETTDYKTSTPYFEQLSDIMTKLYLIMSSVKSQGDDFLNLGGVFYHFY